MGDWILAVAGIIAASTAIGVAVRRSARALRRVTSKIDRMFEVVNGADAVPDPDRPGEYLRPATPDIGVRMTRLEDYVRAGTGEAYAERAQRAADVAQERATAAETAARAAAISAHAAEEATHTAQSAQTIAERAAEAAQKAEQHAQNAAADAARALDAVRQITREH